LFDDQAIDVPCRERGSTTPTTIRELKAQSDPRVTCDDCRETIRIEAGDFLDKLDKLEKSWNDLRKKLSGLGSGSEGAKKAVAPRMLTTNDHRRRRTRPATRANGTRG
jgi:hypothetical protein